MADEEANALHAQIAEVSQELQAEHARTLEAFAQTRQATERQRLRRELESVRRTLKRKQESTECERRYRQRVDADLCGTYVHGTYVHEVDGASKKQDHSFIHNFSGRGSTQCSQQVAHGEYIWTVTGMSWLNDALWATDEGDTPSSVFQVGHSMFVLVYCPDAGSSGRSLAIEHLPAESPDFDFSLRYSIYIRARDGAFVQWGETGHFRYDTGVPFAERNFLFGPEMHMQGQRPLGIFGLTHEQLLQSEWVQDDVLTVKCILKVRLAEPPEIEAEAFPKKAELPRPTLACDMQKLLEKSTNSDVQFMVQDETIQAHSSVLCARPVSSHNVDAPSLAGLLLRSLI